MDPDVYDAENTTSVIRRNKKISTNKTGWTQRRLSDTFFFTWKQLSQMSNDTVILQKYADYHRLNFDQKEWDLQPAG